MTRLSIVVMLLFLPAVPVGATDFHPTVELAYPGFHYARTLDSIHDLDFKNLGFRIFDERGKTIVVAPLRRGLYDTRLKKSKQERVINNWVRLDWVKFLDNDSEFAVIGLSWVSTGGSASDYGVIQVFGLLDKHPVILQQFTYNTRGCQKAGATFNAATGVLRIAGVHGWEHCCPTTLDIVSYQWTGSEFRRRSAKSVPLQPNC